MADTPKQEAGGLEKILTGSLMAGGIIVGDMVASYFGLGPLGTLISSAVGGSAGALAEPLAYAAFPGKSFLNMPVDPLYQKIGGYTAAAITALAVATTMATPIGWAYAALAAIPAYFIGGGAVGAYFKPAVDSIASLFKGTANAGNYVANSIKQIGSAYHSWAAKVSDGFSNAGREIYKSFSKLIPTRAPA